MMQVIEGSHVGFLRPYLGDNGIRGGNKGRGDEFGVGVNWLTVGDGDVVVCKRATRGEGGGGGGGGGMNQRLFWRHITTEDTLCNILWEAARWGVGGRTEGGGGRVSSSGKVLKRRAMEDQQEPCNIQVGR